MPPDVGGGRRVKVHTPHARLGCIGSAHQSRLLGDKFCEVGRLHAEAGCQMSEVHDVSMEVLFDPDAASFSF